jgi:hypothetical protein
MCLRILVNFNYFINLFTGYSNPSTNLNNHVANEEDKNNKNYNLTKSKSHNQHKPQAISSGVLNKELSDDIIFHIVCFKVIICLNFFYYLHIYICSIAKFRRKTTFKKTSKN